MMRPSLAAFSASSADSFSGTQGSSRDAELPRLQNYLNNCKSFYSCIHCRAHLADHDDLISRTFHGSHGRAHLFKSVINVTCDPPVQRHLITGSHLVSDIRCSRCKTTLGWKYEKAYVESQKYKEGKYVIELVHVIRESRHLELDESEIFFGQIPYQRRNPRSGESSAESSYSNNSAPMAISPTISSSNANRLSSNEALVKIGKAGYDEDLLFTFYDDWCASRSSYPINLSWTHFNRKRRSLYLESKPYDWKNSEPDSEYNDDPSEKVVYASSSRRRESSLGDSPDMSPSSSTSPSCENSYNNKARRQGKRHDEMDVSDSEAQETQFKFDSDRPSNGDTADLGNKKKKQGYDPKNGQSNISVSSVVSDCHGEASHMANKEDQGGNSMSATNCDSSSGGKRIENISTSSEDDEEFFDCYISHETL